MAVTVGDPAPPLDLVDWQGNRWRLEDHRGHPVVLLFHRDLAWLPCKAHAGAVRDRLGEFGDAEVAVVLFTRQRNLRGYRGRYVAPLDVVTDETRAGYRAYGLGLDEDGAQLGGDAVVGRDGRLVLLHRSARADDRPSVDDLVEAVRRA